VRSGVLGRTRPVAPRLLGAGRSLASVVTSAWSARERNFRRPVAIVFARRCVFFQPELELVLQRHWREPSVKRASRECASRDVHSYVERYGPASCVERS
jgi:hypothetical protein